MSSKSLSDIAYEKLKRKRKEIVFSKLWKEVAEEVNFSEEISKRKVASFYNAMMMDSRFISLEGNKWDLRERHTLESLQIDPDLLDTYDDYDEDFEEFEIVPSIEEE
ncbi:DNA-directed RNA polymerase subunit delta [Erysipelothrix rhusiopathiae]|uniref:RNAP delta factor n=2 Tax=Erysipelothrix TaxID=1647 RepID=E7FWT5_ERYRH|nr:MULTISPECIES: DNA-directed RNA polymerase subunit delta [Erysipelothrix]CAH2760585.1 DNA-directed RNA polymerase subunit delta [Erysipelothrix sp. A18Y020d]AGN24927.1 DNA-directed RNA polymerase subunit delta [Erysipelothrix rhusiopathiae SY1027]AMS10343.1 DNA-directed RNA polymerase subunit delta [Erysipelothrix rhusiopathiae]AOO67316.1 DNA-directed RNA polymerase subunit delta [Erysipelothrix rhusiopathiae]AWU42295.1 DNA-directed RNA polymerase subunit delta [Erysipelothrix rhusiopathiae]